MRRRTLSAALPMGELNDTMRGFLKAGSPASASPASAALPTAPPLGEHEKEFAAPPRQVLRLHEDDGVAPEPGLVSLTVRVPRTMPPALLLASADRKLRRLQPCTQQEIVAEALTLWLKNHGYL